MTTPFLPAKISHPTLAILGCITVWLDQGPPLLQWIAIALGTAGTITKALVWNHTNVYDGD